MSEPRITRTVALTPQQIIDYMLVDASDVDVENFSRAKTDEVAEHFQIDPKAAYRALDALARLGILTKTRDEMKKHRGKTAVGYQWWEYTWKPGDLARYEQLSGA
jgi:predicted transcriptional regulator